MIIMYICNIEILHVTIIILIIIIITYQYYHHQSKKGLNKQQKFEVLHISVWRRLSKCMYTHQYSANKDSCNKVVTYSVNIPVCKVSWTPVSTWPSFLWRRHSTVHYCFGCYLEYIIEPKNICLWILTKMTRFYRDIAKRGLYTTFTGWKKINYQLKFHQQTYSIHL